MNDASFMSSRERFTHLHGEVHGALRLELAAALVSAGDEAGAREALAAGEIPAVDLARLPEPDREQLVAAGLVEIRAGRVVVPD